MRAVTITAALREKLADLDVRITPLSASSCEPTANPDLGCAYSGRGTVGGWQPKDRRVIIRLVKDYEGNDKS